jgi:hypothetical protein
LNNAASRRALALVTLLLTSTLTACGGGGGGGGSSPPGNPPVNAPAPGPGTGSSGSGGNGSTAAPNPGGTTPTPVPPINPGTPPSSPTPSGSTPTPVPSTNSSQPTQGTTILPNTSGRFSLIQMADEYGLGNASLTTQQIQSEAPYYDAVWASFPPNTQTWNTSHPGMILSAYVIPFEDMYLMSNHNLQWWQTNHPSWIMYACDSSGNPTTYNPWSTSGFPNDVPLNINNSAVVNYELTQVIVPYLQQNGFNAIAIDQVTFDNFLQAPNPELGQPNPPSPYNGQYYDCGYYAQGVQNPSSFVHVYGAAGQDDWAKADGQFIQDELNWVQTAKNTLAQYNIKVLINHPPVSTTPSGKEATLLNSVDGVVDENGFTDYGQYAGEEPTQFAATLSWVQYVQQQMHKAVFLADYFFTQGSTSETSATQLSDAQADWALSTYAIANNGGLGMFVAPQGVGEYSYRPEFSKTYGAACGAYAQNGDLYMRQFQNGFAVVNASSNAANAPLPSGNIYTDIETGQSISGSMTLAPATGSMLLLSSGTGCSASGSSTLRHGTAVPGVRRP